MPLARVGKCKCAQTLTILIFVYLGSRWVYILLQRHIQLLGDIPAEVGESAAEPIEEFDEEAPLLSLRQAQSST